MHISQKSWHFYFKRYSLQVNFCPKIKLQEGFYWYRLFLSVIKWLTDSQVLYRWQQLQPGWFHAWPCPRNACDTLLVFPPSYLTHSPVVLVSRLKHKVTYLILENLITTAWVPREKHYTIVMTFHFQTFPWLKTQSAKIHVTEHSLFYVLQ